MLDDYVVLELETKKNIDEIVDLLKLIFSEYDWKGGDSDAVGKYIVGRYNQDIKIKIWFDDQPYDMAISFTIEDKNIATKIKKEVMEKINTVFIPKL